MAGVIPLIQEGITFPGIQEGIPEEDKSHPGGPLMSCEAAPRCSPNLFWPLWPLQNTLETGTAYFKLTFRLHISEYAGKYGHPDPWESSWEPRGNLARVAKKHPHIVQKIADLIANLSERSV